MNSKIFFYYIHKTNRHTSCNKKHSDIYFFLVSHLKYHVFIVEKCSLYYKIVTKTETIIFFLYQKSFYLKKK